MSTFSLSVTAQQGRQFVPLLRKRLKAAHDLAASRLRELSVALVNDDTMSELHLHFMQLPGPTDVLTFPLEVDASGTILEGEVVVCVPEARRRAAEQNVAVADELLLYALHGLLHLDGYDDRTASDYRRMHAMEDRILVQLGVGPVFSRGRAKSVRKLPLSSARGGR